MLIGRKIAGGKPRRVHVPADVAAFAGLPAPDYTYACQVPAPTGRTCSAELWARAVFEGAPIHSRVIPYLLRHAAAELVE